MQRKDWNALEDAFGRNEPLLIEVTVGILPSSQQLMPMRRLRGE